MKLTQYTTEELLNGCRAGNRRVQEALYRQMSAKMLAVCMRYARDAMEAEDILQNGFIKIFQKIGEYRSDGAFEGWIRRIMVNTAIEHYRKNKRSMHIVSIEETTEQPSGNINLNNLGMQDLMKVIQKLADGYRMVFNMYAIEGYSHKEIAESLGISEGASKSQLSRARSILKQEIIKLEGINYATYAG
ncbi:RNA polymerase sigma factor [Pedobacter faecalis]|uniref:RNA polymerase sigma factor n=1 Tax=Pedobacter faecalis TaxID=3041495 RepID=UPI0025503E84|nr:RNA polymerase sigma factor [Pedobacter sp. ELA7]